RIQHRGHAALHVLLAQARADHALFDEVHRRGQRAGTQQQGQVRSFLRAFQAGGLELLAEHAVDGGHRDDLLAGAGDADFLAVRAGGDLGYALDVDHRHRLADVSLVKSNMRWPPMPFRRTETIGVPVCWSKPERASTSWSPVAMTRLLRMIGMGFPSGPISLRKNNLPSGGTMPLCIAS